jgi:hypothetical protein
MGLEETGSFNIDTNKVKVVNRRQGSIYELPEDMWEILEELGTTEVTFVDLELNADWFLENADAESLKLVLEQEIKFERYENVKLIQDRIKELEGAGR